MRAVHMPIPYMNRRNDYLIWMDTVHQHRYCCDISNGIHRPNLMKVDIRDRDSMDMALCLSYEIEYSHNIILHILREIEMMAYNMLYIRKPMMLMVMVMLMFVLMDVFMVMLVLMVMVVMMSGAFLFSVHENGYMRSCNTAFHGFLCRHMDSRNPKAIEIINKTIPVRDKLQQGRCEHIAGSTHSAINI